MHAIHKLPGNSPRSSKRRVLQPRRESEDRMECFRSEAPPVLFRRVRRSMPDRSVFVIGNDWEVLVWAWKLNTVKIDQSMK